VTVIYLARFSSHEKVCLSLPASPGEIGEAWGALDHISDNVASTYIAEVDCDVIGIEQYLKCVDINDPEQLKKMNRIAGIIESLDNDKCYIFEGALNIEDVSSLDDVINIGETLDQYILIPASTAYMLGIFLVQSDIVHFDKNVIPYLDHSCIGTEFDSNHGGAYTSGGYTVRRDCVEPALIDAVKVYEKKPYEMQMG